MTALRTAREPHGDGMNAERLSETGEILEKKQDYYYWTLDVWNTAAANVPTELLNLDPDDLSRSRSRSRIHGPSV